MQDDFALTHSHEHRPEALRPALNERDPYLGLGAIRFKLLILRYLVALSGIEREWHQFSRVQMGLSLCKHVQSVWADHAPGDMNSRGGLHVVAKTTALPPAREQAVVCLVGADPEPVHVIAAPPRHGPVAPSDLCGPDVAFAGEAKGRVKRIVAEESELLVRERTDLFGQITIAVPE